MLSFIHRGRHVLGCGLFLQPLLVRAPAHLHEEGHKYGMLINRRAQIIHHLTVDNLVFAFSLSHYTVNTVIG